MIRFVLCAIEFTYSLFTITYYFTPSGLRFFFKLYLKGLVEFFWDIFSVFAVLTDTFSQQIFYLTVDGTEILIGPRCKLIIEL